MPKAADYDKLTTEEPGHEMPDGPKPGSSNAKHARKRAIRDSRLICHPRAEVERAEAVAARARAVEPAPAAEEVTVDDAEPFEPAHSLEPDLDDTGDTATGVDPDEDFPPDIEEPPAAG